MGAWFDRPFLSRINLAMDGIYPSTWYVLMTPLRALPSHVPLLRLNSELYRQVPISMLSQEE